MSRRRAQVKVAIGVCPTRLASLRVALLVGYALVLSLATPAALARPNKPTKAAAPAPPSDVQSGAPTTTNSSSPAVFDPPHGFKPGRRSADPRWRGPVPDVPGRGERSPAGTTTRPAATRHESAEAGLTAKANNAPKPDESTHFTPGPARARFTLGAGATGRSFYYDGPLQGESSLARPALRASLELSTRGLLPDTWGMFGVSTSWTEVRGQAELERSDGTIARERAEERRLVADLFYAITLGPKIALYPRLGIGHWHYQVAGRTILAPSACTADKADICLARVGLLHARLGLGARVKLAGAWGLDGVVVGLAGLKLDGASGELASEMRVHNRGLGGEAGLNYAVDDRFSLRASFELQWVSHNFARKSWLNYGRADERYLGFLLNASLGLD